MKSSHTVDIMIDIETLSTKPNAKILTIAAIKFSRIGNLKPLSDMDTFYRRISSDQTPGFDIDPDTQKWWSKQGEVARIEAFTHKNRVPLKQALNELIAWFGTRDIIVWAKSPSFDCVILENAFRVCDIGIPWNFWSTRDCRTLTDISGICEVKDTEISHHALNDCYTQIVNLKKSFKQLNIYQKYDNR